MLRQYQSAFQSSFLIDWVSGVVRAKGLELRNILQDSSNCNCVPLHMTNSIIAFQTFSCEVVLSFKTLPLHAAAETTGAVEQKGY